MSLRPSRPRQPPEWVDPTVARPSDDWDEGTPFRSPEAFAGDHPVAAPTARQPGTSPRSTWWRTGPTTELSLKVAPAGVACGPGAGPVTAPAGGRDGLRLGGGTPGAGHCRSRTPTAARPWLRRAPGGGAAGDPRLPPGIRPGQGRLPRHIQLLHPLGFPGRDPPPGRVVSGRSGVAGAVLGAPSPAPGTGARVRARRGRRAAGDSAGRRRSRVPGRRAGRRRPGAQLALRLRGRRLRQRAHRPVSGPAPLVGVDAGAGLRAPAPGVHRAHAGGRYPLAGGRGGVRAGGGGVVRGCVRERRPGRQRRGRLLRHPHPDRRAAGRRRPRLRRAEPHFPPAHGDATRHRRPALRPARGAGRTGLALEHDKPVLVQPVRWGDGGQRPAHGVRRYWRSRSRARPPPRSAGGRCAHRHDQLRRLPGPLADLPAARRGPHGTRLEPAVPGPPGGHPGGGGAIDVGGRTPHPLSPGGHPGPARRGAGHQPGARGRRRAGPPRTAATRREPERRQRRRARRPRGRDAGRRRRRDRAHRPRRRRARRIDDVGPGDLERGADRAAGASRHPRGARLPHQRARPGAVGGRNHR